MNFPAPSPESLDALRRALAERLVRDYLAEQRASAPLQNAPLAQPPQAA